MYFQDLNSFLNKIENKDIDLQLVSKSEITLCKTCKTVESFISEIRCVLASLTDFANVTFHEINMYFMCMGRGVYTRDNS